MMQWVEDQREQADVVLNKEDINQLFAPPRYGIHTQSLYLWRFRKIPHTIESNGLNVEAFKKRFMSRFGDHIIDEFKSWDVSRHKADAALEHHICLLKGEALVHMNLMGDYLKILFNGEETEMVSELRKLAESMMSNPADHKIHVLLNSHMGLELKGMDVKRPKLRLEDNYNDDFIDVHQTILKRLKKKNEKGIVLLHGHPGTGKSYYIRYLISKLNKRIIFLPADLGQSVTSPDFMPLLMDNPNSILVIEDAEKLITDRKNDKNSPVSALLNIADGLLSDCLNIQMICSFNTDLHRIDPALLRKGRLIARYEFKDLTLEKARSLGAKLKHPVLPNAPMPLNAIYNMTESDYQPQERKAMGFGSK